MTSSLPTEFQSFIHLSRYSRWIESENRRETWPETVKRYFDFFENHLKQNFNYDITDIRYDLEQSVLNLEVMPSMRALMTAGPALERDNVAGYNCCFVACNKLRVFDEILYILSCGTGVGFSVEEQDVDKLPTIAENFYESDTVIVVKDSKIGWARAYKELVSLLVSGEIPKWDVSKVRPSGARLKTFGGRASGPEPLVDLFKFTVELFKRAKGRKLSTLECHDIICKIASVIVVGGVRRSALISLSSLSDQKLRHAKTGQWWLIDPQRALANNSAVYEKTPDIGTFMEEWVSLYQSKSGERGMFNREAAQKQAAKNGRRDHTLVRGVNPCAEILLRDKQFCNLSEVIARPEDNFTTLSRKVRNAAILGTFQATLTDFRYLSSDWKKNTEEEALLGVSITGIMDNLVLSNRIPANDFGEIDPDMLPHTLVALKNVAIETNKEFAAKIGINQATAVTTVKPSGTVSALVDSASGIHARHAPFFIRRVRGDNKDPLTAFMKEMGIPNEPCVLYPQHTTIFSFPMKSPEGSVFRTDMTATQQLEIWKIYQDYWCEHKPSVTISVKEHEWLDCASWVYDNFESMSGVSFLPHAEHSYTQAPFEDCTEEQYNELLAKMPNNIDWTLLRNFEKEDTSNRTQELACSAGSCELVDFSKN